MSLPNANRAVVDANKLRDYLLSSSHPVGRFKATVFFALGYSAAGWELLRDDILAIARTRQAVPGLSGPFGRKFEVNGILTGPNGRSADIRTIWLVRSEDEAPRFVTAYPR